MKQRIIGSYTGDTEGPLLICIGGIHGNEPAGIVAIDEVLQWLENQKLNFPNFNYRGAFLGLKGNLEAIRQKKRFIDRDLNRMLSPEEINQFRSQPAGLHLQEEKECIELLDLIEEEIHHRKSPLTLILDLHTTTASGGVFSIAAEDNVSLSLAKGLHIPVILGIASGLKGTTIDYFNRPNENIYCVVLEAGQHDDPQSVLRTVSAIINCMRALEAIDPQYVDHHHDGLLIDLGKNLPAVTRLIYHYKIQPGEKFIMKEGFKNFDLIQKGDWLADNQDGQIRAPTGGMILMPKYQPLGDDGFFIVEEVNEV